MDKQKWGTHMTEVAAADYWYMLQSGWISKACKLKKPDTKDYCMIPFFMKYSQMVNL